MNIEKNIFVSMKMLKQRSSIVNNHTTRVHKLIFVIFRRGWLVWKWVTTFKFFLCILEKFLKTDLWFVPHLIKQLIFSFSLVLYEQFDVGEKVLCQILE